MCRPAGGISGGSRRSRLRGRAGSASSTARSMLRRINWRAEQPWRAAASCSRRCRLRGMSILVRTESGCTTVLWQRRPKQVNPAAHSGTAAEDLAANLTRRDPVCLHRARNPLSQVQNIRQIQAVCAHLPITRPRFRQVNIRMRCGPPTFYDWAPPAGGALGAASS